LFLSIPHTYFPLFIYYEVTGLFLSLSLSERPLLILFQQILEKKKSIDRFLCSPQIAAGQPVFEIPRVAVLGLRLSILAWSHLLTDGDALAPPLNDRSSLVAFVARMAELLINSCCGYSPGSPGLDAARL
jgi:hypothetical protein